MMYALQTVSSKCVPLAKIICTQQRSHTAIVPREAAHRVVLRTRDAGRNCRPYCYADVYLYHLHLASSDPDTESDPEHRQRYPIRQDLCYRVIIALCPSRPRSTEKGGEEHEADKEVSR